MKRRSAGGFDRIEDLPDDTTREKEVYARFGLAMFHAQVFESGMVLMIVALITVGDERAGTRGGREAFAELLEDLYSRTAGQVLARLRDEAELSPELEALLRRALKVRNNLAHGWFREHGLRFGSATGMQQMVDDLDQAQVTLQDARAQVHAHTAMMLSSLAGERLPKDIEIIRERYQREFEADRSGG